MNSAAYILALFATTVVTSFVLWNKHGRSPFGDNGNRALKWWGAVVVIDGIVTAALLAGSIALSSLDQLSGLGDVTRSIAIGVLGPLGIRSLVREVNIGGKPEKVGLTTISDKSWIYCDRRLDGQITVLRRRDRQRTLAEIQAHGWQSHQVLVLLEEHVADLKSTSDPERKVIADKANKALTMPTEDTKLLGLIKVIEEEKLNSLLYVLRESGPETGQ